MPKRSLPGQKEFNRLNLAVEKLLKGGRGEPPLHTGSGDPLVRIAERLKELPREEFKASLKANLERSASMATLAEPVTTSHTLAMPRLTFKRVATAIDFYSKAFGAEELFRFEVGDSIAHAEIRIGDSVLTFSEEWPEGNRYSAETLGV